MQQNAQGKYLVSTNLVKSLRMLYIVTLQYPILFGMKVNCIFFFCFALFLFCASLISFCYFFAFLFLYFVQTFLTTPNFFN